jgi:CheY-like chemotaxis protein
MHHSPLHILLVEDNPDHAELVRRHLEYLPVATRIHHVEDGEAALNYILGQGSFAQREQFPMPDVVLLDLRLPRMDGLEVLRLVKSQAEFQCLPVVVLTTSDAERDVKEAYAWRADGFLTKPTDFGTLLKIFSSLGFIPCPKVNYAPAKTDSLQP